MYRGFCAMRAGRRFICFNARDTSRRRRNAGEPPDAGPAADPLFRSRRNCRRRASRLTAGRNGSRAAFRLRTARSFSRASPSASRMASTSSSLWASAQSSSPSASGGAWTRRKTTRRPRGRAGAVPIAAVPFRAASARRPSMPGLRRAAGCAQPCRGDGHAGNVPRCGRQSGNAEPGCCRGARAWVDPPAGGRSGRR